MKERNQLKTQIERQIKRMKKSERERQTLLSQTVYLGTLGLVMVLPVVAGAYIGHWLDNLTEGYSVRWTIGLLLAGVVMGMLNGYWMIKDK